MTLKPHMETDVEEARKLLAEQGRIGIIWGIEDVKEIRSDLNDEQAWNVLTEVERRHDATNGVNWDSIKSIADELYAEPAPDHGVPSIADVPFPG